MSEFIYITTSVNYSRLKPKRHSLKNGWKKWLGEWFFWIHKNFQLHEQATILWFVIIFRLFELINYVTPIFVPFRLLFVFFWGIQCRCSSRRFRLVP
jgi:hypothetical protein